MAIIQTGDTTININPTVAELSSYQKHGLKPQDRKPSDYLRMVARTFSSFRATPSEETVVSYIHGFDISLNTEDIIIQENWVDKVQPYNIFRITAGACMIDNQLIDIYQDSFFVFETTDFIADTKYAIVIEYDYIEQRDDNVARIRFIDYSSLKFPRLDDLSVVSIEYTDASLDGNYSATDFSGRPGLVIATFATSSELDAEGKSRQIIQSNPAVPGSLVNGIDPQFLSKLYIQNYKLLFEYFGTQSRAIYSSMGMTNANFLAVAPEAIYKATDPTLSEQDDLRSGDMCYFDEVSGKYRRSISSRQKFSQVIGLYLNEVNEGNHLIYTGGVIHIDEAKHGLKPTHQLLTLVPGTHYYLEDADSLFDTQNQIRTIDNYILADSSGRISNRFYPNSVRVGFATASNQIVLNVDHSIEIGTGNLLSLFGNYDEYKKEFDSNVKVITSDQDISELNQVVFDNQTQLVYDEEALGINNVAEVNTFFTSFAGGVKSEDFTYAMYNILKRHFVNGYSYSAIYDADLQIVPGDITGEIAGDYALIENFLLTNKNIYNVYNSISESLSDINILLAAEQVNLTSFLVDFKNNGEITRLSQLEKLLQNDRYVLGDAWDIIDDFENTYILDNAAADYAANVSTNLTDVNTLQNTQDNQALIYFEKIEIINNLKSMVSEVELYKLSLSDIILKLVTKIVILGNTISTNQQSIVDLTAISLEAAGNIMNPDVSKIDIFQMDDHQRQIFNYTYITDRLQKRLLLIDILNDNLLQANTTYTAVKNNTDSNQLQILTALNEVSRVNILISANNNYVTNYTREYNVLRADMGLPAIAEGDVNFDDLGYSDQNIGNYRYGCDDYENTYNGIASNLISVPCGPYTSPTSVITPKNASFTVVDVLANAGHSTGDTVTLNRVDVAFQGEVAIVQGFTFTPNVVITDIEQYVVKDENGVIIDPLIGGIEITTNVLVFYTTDLNADLSTYTLSDPLGNNVLFTQWVERIVYKPDANYAGPDTFGYAIEDSTGKIATGTVNVAVTGPYALPDYYTLSKNSIGNILDVLSNDGHTNNERIILMSVTQPTNGVVSLNVGTDLSAGEISFTPNADFIGTDTFEYVITDGNVIIDIDGNATTDGTTATAVVSLNILNAI